MSKGLELGIATAQRRHWSRVFLLQKLAQQDPMKRGIQMGALPESSGAEPGGCTASRAPQHRAGRSRRSLGVGPPRARSGHIWFSRNWEASHWLCCPRAGARPPTVAESGQQLGSGVEAPQWGDCNTLVQSLASRVRKTWIQILLDY